MRGQAIASDGPRRLAVAGAEHQQAEQGCHHEVRTHSDPPSAAALKLSLPEACLPYGMCMDR